MHYTCRKIRSVHLCRQVRVFFKLVQSRTAFLFLDLLCGIRSRVSGIIMKDEPLRPDRVSRVCLKLTLLLKLLLRP